MTRNNKYILDKEKNEYVKVNKSVKKKNKNSIDTLTIKIPHFTQKIITELKLILDSIECSSGQKQDIWSKSLKVFEEYQQRAEDNEYYIPKNANIKVIASAIIYTVIVSNHNMPTVTMAQISNLPRSYISTCYKKYFEKLYPRVKFRFSSYQGFKRIRNIISLYIFDLLQDKTIETSKLVLLLKNKIIQNNNLPQKLNQKDIKILQTMVTQYLNDYHKYFSDLVEIIKQLIISSKVYRKLNAHIVIKYLVDLLERKDVHLLQKPKVFHYSVIQIFDFLKEKSPNFFPTRIHTQEKLSPNETLKREMEYRRILGMKIKIYAILNIYNGRYSRNGVGNCPECQLEDFSINTDISRLFALQFHHNSDKKETQFTADNLYILFIKKQSDPNVLEDIIHQIESEKVVLLCRNHHSIFHDKYYNLFEYLINWDDIFSLSAEEIYIIIITSINNNKSTKNLPMNTKKEIRRKIIKKLKKKGIIEFLYGRFCHTCSEISTNKFLPAFHFCHQERESKTVNASDLFDLPCSEILQILEKENGGYICSNCHSVIDHGNYIHLLDKIYENNKIIKKITDDHDSISKKFAPIKKNQIFIRDFLKKVSIIQDSFERYLTAIYEISNSGQDVTTPALKEYLSFNSSTVLSFFTRRSKIIKRYVNIEVGRPTKYFLNDRGYGLIELIYHFKKYYNNA
jgi:hypothetical protein